MKSMDRRTFLQLSSDRCDDGASSRLCTRCGDCPNANTAAAIPATANQETQSNKEFPFDPDVEIVLRSRTRFN